MTTQNFHTGYIAIIGRPNVGKSTLLNCLVGQNISITSKKAQTTRHRINGILTDGQSQFIFVDTPGFQIQHMSRLNSVMNRNVTQSMHGVDIIIFMIEALYFDEREEQILNFLPADKPIILAINKIDRVLDKSKLLPFLEKISKIFSFSAMIPISAEYGIQTKDLIQEIRTHLPEGLPLFSGEEATDRSERFLAAELIREKLFRLMWDEIPYSTCVIIDQFTNESGLRRIYASIIVDRVNQKAMIIGKNGGELKLIATQSRRDMEKLFGSKVYLKVWVKVKNGWANDLRTLKTLGYE
tara:strand:+ start:2112 stop:3002 length:891 start_codon:yes stop_codon:yes gene_type:complete